MSELASEPASVARGVNAAFLGVADPRPSADFFCGQLGFQVSESSVIAIDVAEPMWGDGVGAVPVTVLSAAGTARAIFEPVWVPPTRKRSRPSASANSSTRRA